MKKGFYQDLWAKAVMCFTAALLLFRVPVFAEEPVVIDAQALCDEIAETNTSVSGNEAGQSAVKDNYTIRLDLNGLEIAKTKEKVNDTWNVRKDDTYESIMKELGKIKPKNNKKTIRTGEGQQNYILCWIDSQGNKITNKSKITGDETLRPVWVSVKVKVKKKKEKLNVVIHCINTGKEEDSKVGDSQEQKKNSVTNITIDTYQGKSDKITKVYEFYHEANGNVKTGAIKGETYKIKINYTGLNGKDKSSVSMTWIYSPLPIKSFTVGKYDNSAARVPLKLKWKSKDIDGWELYESKTGKEKDFKMVIDYAVTLKQINVVRTRAVKGVKYKGRTYYINRSGKKVYCDSDSDWKKLKKPKVATVPK